MSFEQLDRVLLLLEGSDPASWLLTKEGHTPPATPPLTATEAPSLPLPPATAAADELVMPQGACVICYDEPISVTLVHANETSHLCVCVACSDRLKAISAPCPVCREGIVVHLKSMFTVAQAMQ